MLGGDASCATNGFWSALTIATTQKLPMLFYVEDNQYGISVPSSFQTPGGDIAKNLASFTGLHVLSGDGTDPSAAARLIDEAVAHVRAGRGRPCCGSPCRGSRATRFQDTQTYKSDDVRQSPNGRAIRCRGSRRFVGEEVWEEAGAKARAAVAAARAEAEARGVSDPERVTAHVFYDGEMQQRGRPVDQGL